MLYNTSSGAIIMAMPVIPVILVVPVMLVMPVILVVAMILVVAVMLVVEVTLHGYDRVVQKEIKVKPYTLARKT